jgi:hypothetical protein
VDKETGEIVPTDGRNRRNRPNWWKKQTETRRHSARKTWIKGSWEGKTLLLLSHLSAGCYRWKTGNTSWSETVFSWHIPANCIHCILSDPWRQYTAIPFWELGNYAEASVWQHHYLTTQ